MPASAAIDAHCGRCHWCGQMVNPVSLVGLAARVLRPLSEQARFERVRDEQMRDWLAELAEQVARLERRYADLQASVTENVERQLLGTILRLTPDALGALTEDHRSLLAAAAASVLRPDFETEMKSRVLRAVTVLEPSDVVHLRTLAADVGADTATRIASFLERQTRRAEGFEAKDPSVLREFFSESVLSTAHLLDTEDGGLEVTPLGHETLRYLSEWHPAARRAPK